MEAKHFNLLIDESETQINSDSLLNKMKQTYEISQFNEKKIRLLIS